MSCCCEFQGCDKGAKVLGVIFDLDGTLLDTERASRGVLNEFLARYGKELDREKEDKKRWAKAKALPGANRLIKHFQKNGVPVALASNSLREYIDAKISYHKGWKESFSVILGSDQVKAGKPSPYLFEEAAKKMGLDAINCLVIEDSFYQHNPQNKVITDEEATVPPVLKPIVEVDHQPILWPYPNLHRYVWMAVECKRVGVKAANAAQMKIVAVPSEREADCNGLANVVLHSLLEFQPELWGLPPFDDWLDDTLPIEPIHLSGLYVTGCLEESTDNATLALPDQVVGLYLGWAKIDTDRKFKILASINLDFSCVSYKRIRVYLVDSNSDLKQKQKMQISLVGYIRTWDNKELSSTAFDKLEEYKSIARASLDLPSFTCL
ncbi:hypothetical protein V8G54_025670 [Vigna mungo]|uniref:Riboflavin kinase domain-containing protein n=1 Tax=Vigna mungo TaxID=3915 RepID=A0AAQ3MZL2_VIGMU